MRLRTLTALLLALIVGSIGAVIAQERFGGLAGVVSDPSGGAVPGATVTVTNSQTGAARTVVSGADGSYLIPNLEPGKYSVAVELQGFQRFVAEDILIILGRTFTVNAGLKLGALTETVSVTAESEKQLDLKTVTLSHNVTSEQIDRMPKSRTFQGIALTAPGVNQGTIEGGFQVNGASGSENSYTVDGVNTNSLIYGGSRQDTVFEYVQEVQVKTAGIDAEYGGALGGVISAVTKSGGNAFHGEGHYYYYGSGVGGTPHARLVLNPADDTTIYNAEDPKQRNHNSEPGGSIGGPIVRDRLFFFGSVSPRITRRTNEYLFSSGTEPGTIDQDQTYTQMFGKVSYNANRVQANGSLLATPLHSNGTLTLYNGIEPLWVSSSKAANASQPGRGYDQDQYNFSGDVNIWLGRNNFVTVRGGYFYDNYNDKGIPTTTSVSWLTSSIGTPGVPPELQQPIGYQNTPQALISNFDTTKTSLFQIDYNHGFNAAGSHLLKGGFGVRHTTNDVNNAYPGGFTRLFWNQSFAFGGVNKGSGQYGYYEVNDRGTQGLVKANMPAFYIQDAWTIGSRLTLNLGIRTEKETIPSFRTEIKENAFVFGWGDKFAPRLGASYDVLGNGRLKAFASWGRYFDWVKYELARGSFGGDVWNIYYHSLDTLDVYNLNLSNMPGRNLWPASTGPCNVSPCPTSDYRDRRVPNFNTVDPDIKPMSQDATNVGIEYQINPTTVFGATYVHNNLRRTIEDIGSLDANGNEIYFEANPGEGVAVRMPSTGLTPCCIATPRPIRKYDALELTLGRRFSKNWFGNANVTISRLYGNYAGLQNSDEITTPTVSGGYVIAQQQAGNVFRPGSSAGRAWDLDELEFDAHGHLDVVGRLATDRPVVAKFYGGYQFKFGTQLGLFQYVGSGTPISTYVNTTNQIPVFVEGRGDLGRTPTLSHTDLLVSHDLDVGRKQRVRFELNIINLFNQKTATHMFNCLNKGCGPARGDSAADLSGQNLMNGYDYRALISASPSGAGAFDPRYKMADLWQAPIQGQFSIKWIF